MPQFYQSISKYYDFIFELGDSQKNFYQSLGIKKDSTILDIGCATGDLSIFLSKQSKNVTGIDLDADMIEIAKQKLIKEKISNVDFNTGDMEKLDISYKPNSFDLVFCMGNTLVHLDTISKIETFFLKVKNILKDNGLFIFQIMNYQKILTENIKALPLIENINIKFERFYKKTKNNLLNFHTVLTIKNENKVVNNEVDLYPATKTEIDNIVEKSDFEEISSYGSFAKDQFSQDLPLLISILKKNK